MNKPKFDIGQQVWIVYFCGGHVEKPMEHYTVAGPTKIAIVHVDEGGILYGVKDSVPDWLGLIHGSFIFTSQAEAEAAREKNAIAEIEHRKKVRAERGKKDE